MAPALVCHVSTFPPTPCGIATYTADLIDHLAGWAHARVAMTFSSAPAPDPPHDFGVRVASANDYRAAVDFINESSASLVSLQHEFGIFGGDDGEYVLKLLEGIAKPIVVTLHTVSRAFGRHKAHLTQQIIRRSDYVVVLTEASREILVTDLAGDIKRIAVIRHGVPEIDFIHPDDSPVRKKLAVATVFVSAGHLRPSKGYHLALSALAKYKRHFQDFRYLLVGTAQPQYATGPPYRRELKRLVHEEGLDDNVSWIEDYLPSKDLHEYMRSADVGLVTYTEEDQASSGIIPLMLACGRPVVATSFDYAQWAAARMPGIRLAAFDDTDSICRELCRLTQDPAELRKLMYAAYTGTRPLLWASAARKYEGVFASVLPRGGASIHA